MESGHDDESAHQDSHGQGRLQSRSHTAATKKMSRGRQADGEFSTHTPRELDVESGHDDESAHQDSRGQGRLQTRSHTAATKKMSRGRPADGEFSTHTHLVHIFHLSQLQLENLMWRVGTMMSLLIRTAVAMVDYRLAHTQPLPRRCQEGVKRETGRW